MNMKYYMLFVLFIAIISSACAELKSSIPVEEKDAMLKKKGWNIPDLTPSCALHEFYGCFCENTCAKPNFCNAERREKIVNCTYKCLCLENYVRSSNGSCVLLGDCPREQTNSTTSQPTMKCGLNETFKECLSCEKTCSDPNPICNNPCMPGCTCKDGHYKAPDGKCVLYQDCPKEPAIHIGAANEPSIDECQPDEVFVWCGWCEGSCSQPDPECPPDVCTRGCLCRPPLLRHRSGHCVEQKDCFGQTCPNRNEEYVCRYGCEPRCERRVCVRRRRCSLGCHCKLGLLRDIDGSCVTRDKCARYMNTTAH